jgi:DNA-binding transcriptional LysR family regulator
MTRQTDWESQVGRRLKLRHLRVFSEVIACGSMAKAAARLRVSQPTISEVIAELEHTFGVRLLDRSPQGVEPTAYGHALLRRSIAAFDELKQCSRDIEFLADPTVGELRVGCPESVSVGILLPALKRFSELHPRVAVHVDDMPFSQVQQAALRERKCDLIVARMAQPLADADDLNVELLLNDRLIVVAAMRSRWARRRKIDLAELVNEPWLLTAPKTWYHTQLVEAFRARGLGMPRATLVTQSAPLRVHLLANSDYLTGFAYSTFRTYCDRYGLKALPVVLPDRPWPVVIMTLKNRTLSPVVSRFIACAREIAKSMAKPGSLTARSIETNVS